MTFRYHSDTDMLHIELATGTSTESQEVAPGFVLDFNQNNEVVGIEIEDASKVIDFSKLELAALPVSNLNLSMAPAA